MFIVIPVRFNVIEYVLLQIQMTSFVIKLYHQRQVKSFITPQQFFQDYFLKSVLKEIFSTLTHFENFLALDKQENSYNNIISNNGEKNNVNKIINRES